MICINVKRKAFWTISPRNFEKGVFSTKNLPGKSSKKGKLYNKKPLTNFKIYFYNNRFEQSNGDHNSTALNVRSLGRNTFVSD